jgi:hypothetical protein
MVAKSKATIGEEVRQKKIAAGSVKQEMWIDPGTREGLARLKNDYHVVNIGKVIDRLVSEELERIDYHVVATGTATETILPTTATEAIKQVYDAAVNRKAPTSPAEAWSLLVITRADQSAAYKAIRADLLVRADGDIATAKELLILDIQAAVPHCIQCSTPSKVVSDSESNCKADVNCNYTFLIHFTLKVATM